MEILCSEAVTQAKLWSPDIFIAEMLAGTFQNAVTNQQDFANFRDLFMENQKQANIVIRSRCKEVDSNWPKVDEIIFANVCSKISELWKDWEYLELGDKLALVWQIKGDTVENQKAI